MAGRIAARRRRDEGEKFMDYSLLFIVLFLVGFGIVMVFSSSSYEANLAGDSTSFLRQQLFASILGLIAMMVAANIPYHFWEPFALPALIGSVVLIFLVIPFGHTAGGATRWIKIAGVSLQVAEVVKIGMILFLARLIDKLGRGIRTNRGFFAVLLPPAIVSVLLWQITNNLSSALIVMGIVVLMLFVACPDYKRFFLMGGAALAVAGGVLLYVTQTAQSHVEDLDFRGGRILAWLDPEAYADGKGFQTIQALYAIGSGGVLGKGLGQSMQKRGFLPEAQNDMIFSIICEELGLFGGISILILFLLLIWRLMIIANNAPDLYGALLVVGVLGHIAVQVILNIAVVTNTIPNTGISLPFISYGGSSALFLLIEIGLTLSVAKGIRLKDL